jgi:rod shape-determining protein MreD
MAEAVDKHIWAGRAAYLALVAALIFVGVLPLDTLPPSWAGPDLVMAVTLVWVTRRPDYVPVWLIAATFLLCDLIFQRPPGLWAALVIVMTEMLRGRATQLRGMPFLFEWLTVGVGLIVATLVYRMALGLVLVPRPPGLLHLSQLAATILAYPLVAALAHWLFGVSRPALGEIDRRGKRL